MSTAAARLPNGTWAEALLSFVQRYPGVHLREIRRRLAIPIGTLDYHLYQLGRKGLIAVRFQGGYKCCFPETPPGFGTPIPEEEKVLLALLRQEVPRAILLTLYLDGPVSPQRLGEGIATSPSNLSYFLKRLEAVGVLERSGAGTTRTVRLLEPTRIHAILLRYPPLPEGSLDRFLRFWGELHP
jgi:predicted transcriptional regulator